MNIFQRIKCFLFHRNYHQRYWSQFALVFYRCNACERRWARKRRYHES
jgi:hypothetical protein